MPVTHAPASQRVGLVLGAGGVTGQGFHAGVLWALHEAAGWDPRTAEVIVGTSAGSEVAALLRAGLSAADLAARAMGEPLSPEGKALLAGVGPPLPIPPLSPALLGRPVAPEALRRALRSPLLARAGTTIAAAMPSGTISIEPLAAYLRPLHGDVWPSRALWICATQLDEARRAVFGRDALPVTDVGTAVAASCAAPGWFKPVSIDGARYLDGGAWSATNLDVLAGLGLDLVVVSAPLARVVRRGRLAVEAAKVRRTGTRVAVFAPTVADLRAMGLNALDVSRRGPATRQAHASVMRRCRRLRRRT
ncbi:MAG: patatin-like phospholipase family protein [Egibacteraceae bacterium]